MGAQFSTKTQLSVLVSDVGRWAAVLGAGLPSCCHCGGCHFYREALKL